MVKKIAIVLIILINLNCPTAALAKKKLGSAPAAGTKTTAVRRTAGVTVSAKLTSDRRNITVNFSNLGIANSVSYMLTYNANNIPQGAGGSISPSETATSRTLYFGTCSHGVCTAHHNITNMKLVITSNLKSGKKVIKTFRVKV